MTEPHLKAIPDPATGFLRFDMDEYGFALFEKLLSRSEPRQADSPASFKATKDRVAGAFLAGAAQMGWTR